MYKRQGKQVGVLAWALDNLSESDVEQTLSEREPINPKWRGKADHERVRWYQAAQEIRKIREDKEEIEEEDAIDEILEKLQEKEIEEEIEIIEETQEEEKNIVASQQKLAEINFIGKTENQILNLLGEPELSRIDGAVYTMRYNSDNCRLFLFFNQNIENKRVEYFELRNVKAELLNSKQSLEQCYREFNLMN